MEATITKTDFKIGDKVRLKSGGPAMTVSIVTASGLAVYCEWHEDDSTVAQAVFDNVTLKRADA